MYISFTQRDIAKPNQPLSKRHSAKKSARCLRSSDIPHAESAPNGIVCGRLNSHLTSLNMPSAGRLPALVRRIPANCRPILRRDRSPHPALGHGRHQMADWQPRFRVSAGRTRTHRWRRVSRRVDALPHLAEYMDGPRPDLMAD